MKGSKIRFLYITGGTGFIGTQLARAWLSLSESHGVVIQTRRSGMSNSTRERFVNSIDQLEPGLHLEAVVNLAGAPIADARSSEKRKRELEESRVDAETR